MNRVLSILGLALKAGKLVSGPTIIDLIRSKQVQLVLVASDAGKNTKKKIFDKSKFYQVECYEFADVNAISKAIGKHNRSAVAITDKGFADLIKKNLKEE